MTYETNEHELASVFSLPGVERFKYFVSKVADWEEIWSLADEDGWALFGDKNGCELVPVWPAKAFASVCCKDQWASYEPRSISVADWIDKWTPGMASDKRAVAVFPTPSDFGVAIEPLKLAATIIEEMEAYE